MVLTYSVPLIIILSNFQQIKFLPCLEKLKMRQILTKAQFAAFVPKVIEIVRTAQGLGQKWY